MEIVNDDRLGPIESIVVVVMREGLCSGCDSDGDVYQQQQNCVVLSLFWHVLSE